MTVDRCFAAIESDVCLAFDRCEVCNAAAAVGITVTDGQAGDTCDPVPYMAVPFTLQRAAGAQLSLLAASHAHSGCRQAMQAGS